MKISQMIESFLGNCLLGFLCSIILAGIGALIWAAIEYPRIWALIGGAAMFMFSLGWCVNNYDNFKTLVQTGKAPDVAAPRIPKYGIAVLDRLDELEIKYKISTVQFISLASSDIIPFGMDNLDYLEWISLANELSSITNERKGK